MLKLTVFLWLIVVIVEVEVVLRQGGSLDLHGFQGWQIHACGAASLLSLASISPWSSSGKDCTSSAARTFFCSWVRCLFFKISSLILDAAPATC